MEKSNKKRNIILTVICIFIITIIATILIIITLISMNKNNQENENLSVKYISSTVIQKMGYQNLSEISQDNIYKYYDIPDGIVSESDMYISTKSDSPTEIACFKISDQSKQNELMDIISDYINSKNNTYNKVNGKEHNNSKTELHYPYAFVVIASDSENAVSTFNSIIENKI